MGWEEVRSMEIEWTGLIRSVEGLNVPSSLNHHPLSITDGFGEGRVIVDFTLLPCAMVFHDREIHTNDSECRENTWNDPTFHSLLSLHSFHSQWVPFISINCIPISSFESPFHYFHSLSHQYHPSISIPLHFNPHPFQSIYHSFTIHPLIHTPHQQPNSAATLTIPFVWS